MVRGPAWFLGPATTAAAVTLRGQTERCGKQSCESKEDEVS